MNLKNVPKQYLPVKAYEYPHSGRAYMMKQAKFNSRNVAHNNTTNSKSLRSFGKSKREITINSSNEDIEVVNQKPNPYQNVVATVNLSS